MSNQQNAVQNNMQGINSAISNGSYQSPLYTAGSGVWISDNGGISSSKTHKVTTDILKNIEQNLKYQINSHEEQVAARLKEIAAAKKTSEKIQSFLPQTREVLNIANDILNSTAPGDLRDVERLDKYIRSLMFNTSFDNFLADRPEESK